MASLAWADWVPPDSSHNCPGTPELVPIFGFHGFGADTKCDRIHPHGPIPSGSRCCCMACNRSGLDTHPGVLGHIKRGSGTIRDDWVEPEVTRYEPIKAVDKKTGKALKGGTGR